MTRFHPMQKLALLGPGRLAECPLSTQSGHCPRDGLPAGQRVVVPNTPNVTLKVAARVSTASTLIVFERQDDHSVRDELRAIKVAFSACFLRDTQNFDAAQQPRF